MPDALLDSRSEFDRAKVLVSRWLRENVGHCRVLSADDLAATGSERRFVAGWNLEIDSPSGPQHFDVLIDNRFPYSPIRVACTTGDFYLQRPHVEPGGVLCLPRRPVPSTGVQSAIAVALSDAVALTQDWLDPTVMEAEFQREFVSYWNRVTDKGAVPIRSLLDAANRQARRTFVWFSEKYTLVGESRDQLLDWLKNRGRVEESKLVTGAFIHLDRPPVPPFPSRIGELFALLQSHGRNATALVAQLSVKEDLAIVAQAHSQSGDGLIGMIVSKPKNFDGFRKSDKLGAHSRLALWRLKSELRKTTVERFDAGWVHGRGFNRDLPKLQSATVVILGCGSLGSQVAHRLAQSGVGGIVLVDPERLSSANVGRHALGIDSVDINKAAALARTLRRHFPHMRRIEDHAISWQSLHDVDPTIFERASLIVSCLGEWSADGQLGEWQCRQETAPPIVYGWLDEFGTASHAIVLSGPTGPALSCVLDQNGTLRVPETLWDNEGLMQAEPACGTLFQPFGPIEAGQAEILVSRLCVDVLTGKTKPPCHRVYAGSTSQLIDAGGRWSEGHLRYRPTAFDGPFEYERSLDACGQCRSCQKTL